ncbi:MAG: hypothetical protein WCA35_12675 [Kovacikia sp.]
MTQNDREFMFLFQRLYKLTCLKNGIILILTVLVGCASQTNILVSEKSSIPAEDTAPLTNKASPLKELVAKQYPDIENPQISDWQKVNLLRRWAYRNIVNSTKSCFLEEVLKPDFYKKTAFELYTAFKQDKGGVQCGGSSIFLEKLYREYNFNAYTLNMGEPSSQFTHVVNLVEIRGKGQKKLVIEDASHNVTLVHQDGSVLDYFTFLRLLSQLKDNQIKIVKDNDGKRNWLFCKDDPLDEPTLKLVRESSSECIDIPNLGLKCKSRVVLEDFTRNYPNLPKNKQFLVHGGYDLDLVYLYLYLHPFSINSEKVGLKKDLLDRAQATIKTYSSKK